MAASGSSTTPRAGSSLLGRYELAEELGRGASAVVFRAFDSLLEETVAVKVLVPTCETGLPPELRINLRGEARAAMRLSHPNILRIANVERDGDLEFLVMEYVSGGDCREFRKRFSGGCIPPRLAVRIVQQTLKGLHYAHQNGVCHHDVKPSNLLLASIDPLPVVKICDFGLSALRAAYRSGCSCLAGTPAYMAPERVSGKEGDHRSDVYSVAVTLYVLGNGVTPFGSDGNTLARHLSEQPPDRSALPPPLHEVVLRGMAKDPAKRYATAADMDEALELALRELSDDDSQIVARTQERERSGATATRSAPPEIETLDDEYIVVELASLAPRSAPGKPPSVRLPPPVPLPGVVRIPKGMRPVPALTLDSPYGRGPIEVPEFLIDEVEVTNEAYLQFIVATGALSPPDWLRNEPPPGQGDHPVVGVSLEEAEAYARWAGKRLPTPAEWEAAARGPDGRPFPWGQWDETRCNNPSRKIGGTTSVRAFPEGAAPDGCLDMIGNVWEWTSGGNTAVDEVTPDTAWAYGGSFRHDCAPGGHIARVEIQVGSSFPYVGFRCARNLR